MLFDFVSCFAQKDEFLVHAAADGDDHTSAVAELLDKRCGNFVRSAGDDDGIEGRVLRPSAETITGFHPGIFAIETLEGLARHLSERFDDFDGENVGAHLGEDGGLIAGA